MCLKNNILIIFLLINLLTNSIFLNSQVHLGPGQAFANVQAAVNAKAIYPGDTVYLHAGSYAGYQLIQNLNGTAHQWIVFTKYKNDLIDISGGWQFVSCSYLRFQNLTFRGNTNHPGRLFSVDNGGSCNTQSKYIQVDQCEFSNTLDANAIVAFKFAGVDSFEVTRNVFKDIRVCSAMDFNTCRNGIIRGNRIENCLTGGHIKGGGRNITMEQNLFSNASFSPWVAFELGGDTSPQFYCPEDQFEVKNIYFYSNIVVGGYRGIALSSARDCKIINNTFHNCSQATLRFLNTSVLYPSLSDNIIENNIFSFGTSAYFNGSTQSRIAASFSHNIYYSFNTVIFNGPYWDTPQLDAIKDENPLLYGSATAMFENMSMNNFKLFSSSPAIYKGKPQIEPMFDFYGKPFSTTARSIGAIEFEMTSDEHSALTEIITWTIVPNPVENYFMIKAEQSKLQFELFNSEGNKMIEFNSGETIQMSNFSSGIYYVRQNNVVQKLVKF
ncbi:MAG: T9SS type A sorting domain-containing protein [Saprospiraceae bacterium]|nr:T9SS type A sorting domain-containing protein [Saprospiraceae bacterium]